MATQIRSSKQRAALDAQQAATQSAQAAREESIRAAEEKAVALQIEACRALAQAALYLDSAAVTRRAVADGNNSIQEASRRQEFLAELISEVRRTVEGNVYKARYTATDVNHIINQIGLMR